MNSMRYDFGDGRMVPARIHKNGGGVIALTCDVEDSVFIGRGCEVSGGTKIMGNCRIVGNVKIIGDMRPDNISVQIEDNVTVSGNSRITGMVLLRDNAQIRDDVVLGGSVQVIHRARVCGQAKLNGQVTVMESSYITGATVLHSEGREMIIRGETFINGQVIEHRPKNETTRKRRVSSLRPVVFDTQPS